MNSTTLSKSLKVSVIVVILVWLLEIARLYFFPNFAKELYKSIPNFLLTALLIGFLYILIVIGLLRYSKESFKDIGFSRENIGKQVKNGLLFGLGIFIASTFIINPIIELVIPKEVAGGVDISALFSDFLTLLLLIFLSIIKGGLSEELWRIFYLIRFEKCWGKTGLIISIFIGSIMFGFGHFYQGLSGVISTTVIGVLYTLVYLRKRLALEVIITHATFDVIAVLFGFTIYKLS